jgi:hypothetical protein
VLVLACLTSLALGLNYLLDCEILAGKLHAGLLTQAVLLFVEAMHGRITKYAAASGEITMTEDVYYLNYLSKVKDICDYL